MGDEEPPLAGHGDEVRVGDRVRVEWVNMDGTRRVEGEGVLTAWTVDKKRGVGIEYRAEGHSCMCILSGKGWAGHREIRRVGG